MEAQEALEALGVCGWSDKTPRQDVKGPPAPHTLVDGNEAGVQEERGEERRTSRPKRVGPCRSKTGLEVTEATLRSLEMSFYVALEKKKEFEHAVRCHLVDGYLSLYALLLLRDPFEGLFAARRSRL